MARRGAVPYHVLLTRRRYGYQEFTTLLPSSVPPLASIASLTQLSYRYASDSRNAQKVRASTATGELWC